MKLTGVEFNRREVSMRKLIAFVLLTVPVAFAKKNPPMPNVTMCVQPMNNNLDGYIIGEMQKQKVPATIISPDSNNGCDPAKSQYVLTGSEDKEGKSFSARSVLGLRVHYRDEVQAAVRLVRTSDQAIVWAGDSDKGEMKKVAERIVNEMVKQRPWAMGPSLGVK
jgi:hypothetical protein